VSGDYIEIHIKYDNDEEEKAEDEKDKKKTLKKTGSKSEVPRGPKKASQLHSRIQV
jgi:hypothetical protein